MIKTIDLFAGAGGLSYGFKMTGKFQFVAAAEINKNARKTYKKNIANGLTNFEFIDNVIGFDFDTLNKRIGGIDVVIGGPPCQGFSNANRQKKNLISMNNSLVKDYFRAIKQIRPKAFVMENVSMLRSETHRFYESVRDNAEIDMLIEKGFSIPKREDTLVLTCDTFEGVDLNNLEELDIVELQLPQKLAHYLSVLWKNLHNPRRLPNFIKKNGELLRSQIEKYIQDTSMTSDGKIFILEKLTEIKLSLDESNPVDAESSLEYIVKLQKLMDTLQEIRKNGLIGEFNYSLDTGLTFRVNSYSVIDYINAILGDEYVQKGDTVNAEWFGVPQERRRHIIIGIRKDIYDKSQEQLKLPEEPEQYTLNTVADAINDLAIYEAGYEKDYAPIDYVTQTDLSDYAQAMRACSTSVKNHITTKTSDIAMNRFKKIKPGKNFHSLDAKDKSTYSKPDRTQNTIYLRLDPAKPSGTVVNVRKSMWIHPTLDRAITVREFELQNPEIYTDGYRVKHFGLYVFDNGNNQWSGISYYRKGMKIGEIDIKDIPKKITDKFWGYIEVDERWEDDLSDIEDKVHFGVSKGKKNTATYQHLKNYCNGKFKANLIEWGYIKDKESEDKKLKDELKAIAEDIQDLFDRLGFEDLGKGPQKADFDVRWQNIAYPLADSEKVTSGDDIRFSVRIKSSYATDKRFEYKLIVISPKNGSVVSQIANDKITIKSNTIFKKDFCHTVTKDNSEQFAENRIILSVKVIGSGKEKSKELPYFYDTEKPDNARERVDLVLHECLFPIHGSRRVNFGEAIRSVCYRIENKRNHALNYRLNVSIHNASDSTCPKIVDITSHDGIIPPFEDAITPYIDEIIFNKEIYEQYLEAGVLELRARLIANEDDMQFEKGDKITYYHFKIFLNSDEKNGKNDSFDVKSVVAPEDFRRSWFTAGTGRTITLNIGHVAYLNVEDNPDIQHEYMREQMLKQYVLLYLAEGKYDMFGEQGKNFAELEPQEAAEQVLQKIESIYFQSLR